LYKMRMSGAYTLAKTFGFLENLTQHDGHF
jgi:hypothetical protein